MGASGWARTRQKEREQKEKAQQDDAFEDVRAFVCASLPDAITKVEEEQEFLSKHREATLHVRGQPRDGDHKFTVFLPDALCCGSSAYWSITELVASLGIATLNQQRNRRAHTANQLGTKIGNDGGYKKHLFGCQAMLIIL